VRGDRIKNDELFTAAAIASNELFGSPKIFFRRFIKAYMKLWLEKNAKGELNLQKAKSPLDAITEYIARLDRRGIQNKNDVKEVSYDGVNIKILQNRCSYSKTCEMMLEHFKEPPICIKAIYYIEAIERRLREYGAFDYRFQYSRDNQNCKILIAKLQEFL